MEREVAVEHRGGVEVQPHRLVAEYAEKRHGVIARRKLLDLGISRRQINRLLTKGLLHEVHRGVYAVGHRNLTREGWWMAAVLALGEGTVLSHLTAAMLWKLVDASDGYPHVTAPIKGHRQAGIIRHAAALGRDEVSVRDGIPVTSVSRTILDLATILDPLALEGALGQAEFHGYAIRPSFATLLERYRGRRGIAILRAVLSSGHHTLGVTESPLEVRFLRFLDERGLERPELNVPLDLDGYPARPDGLYRRAAIAIEIDGGQAHKTDSRFESDRVRDRKLRVAQLEPVRITDAQLADPAASDDLERDLVRLGVRRSV